MNVDNAAGSTLFRIRGDGNTGIGTSAPAAKLDVSGGTTYPAFKTSRDGGSAASQGYTTFGHSAIGYSGGTGADTYIVSEHGYGFAVNGGTTALAITDTGLCGIGTSAPEHALHIYDAGSNNAGTMKIGGSASSLGLEIAYSQAGNTSGSIFANPTYTNDGAVLKIGVDGDRNPNQLVLDGVGNVGIGRLLSLL